MVETATESSAAGPARKHPRRRRWLRRSIVTVLSLVLVGAVVFAVNPWPGALLIRFVFERGAADVKVAMEAHIAANTAVATLLDQPYRENDDDAYLDVYFPESVDGSAEQLPTLIWTHGGAWISGHRDDAAPYFRLVADQGYTVISLGYSLAPEHRYPRAVHQVNDALAHIQANAERYHVDPARIVMAGDSAGAQITSQYAAIVTNPGFATEMGMTPAIAPAQLRGVILFCGIYDLVAFVEQADATSGIMQWGIREALWAWTGSRDSDSTALQQMSTIDHVTPAFPVTFISGGNGDPLTDAHSKPLAERLQAEGVDVTTLFFPPDHEPQLPHEYQFNLDNADGQEALTQVLAFLTRVA